MRRLTHFEFVVVIALALLSAVSGFIGNAISSGVLHPSNLNPERLQETEQTLRRTGAAKADFTVRANDGVELRG
jgi:hypothetical protein